MIERTPCQNKDHMGEHACKNKSQCWEPCGELGHREESVRVVEPEVVPREWRNALYKLSFAVNGYEGVDSFLKEAYDEAMSLLNRPYRYPEVKASPAGLEDKDDGTEGVPACACCGATPDHWVVGPTPVEYCPTCGEEDGGTGCGAAGCGLVHGEPDEYTQGYQDGLVAGLQGMLKKLTARNLQEVISQSLMEAFGRKPSQWSEWPGTYPIAGKVVSDLNAEFIKAADETTEELLSGPLSEQTSLEDRPSVEEQIAAEMKATAEQFYADIKSVLESFGPLLPFPKAKESRCSNLLRATGEPSPRTCQVCGLGPCKHGIRA